MKPLTIGVVGPCGAGKTTLVHRLRALGYQVRHIAQEHSYAPRMWEKLTNPDILVYLDVSYPLTIQRRKLDWTINEYDEEIHRLRHARQHAHLVVNTDPLSPEEVLDRVLAFLKEN